MSRQPKLKRRDVFELLDRDCVNPQTTDAVKAYINRLIVQIESNKTKTNRLTP